MFKLIILTVALSSLVYMKAIASDIDRNAINDCLAKVKDEVLKGAGPSVTNVKVGGHVYLDDKTNQWLLLTCFSLTQPGVELGLKEDQALAGCDKREVIACQMVEELPFIGVHSLSSFPRY